MTDDETGGKVEAAVQRVEDAMLRAYRLWFEHARRCEHCKRVRVVRDGCDDGRELWGVYRLARIGRSTSS